MRGVRGVAVSCSAGDVHVGLLADRGLVTVAESTGVLKGSVDAHTPALGDCELCVLGESILFLTGDRGLIILGESVPSFESDENNSGEETLGVGITVEASMIAISSSGAKENEFSKPLKFGPTISYFEIMYAITFSKIHT